MNSFRRELLDQCLEKYKPLMTGRVLDVGGKKVGRRGSFVPPLENVESWEYLNSDEATKPDYCCSAEKIPLENESVNTIIMTEMLEYLPEPKKVFSEIYRILSGKGHALVSVPFLNPVHGDHWADRARYTPVMLKEIILPLGLKIKLIEPMGALGAVLFDTVRVSVGLEQRSNKTRSFRNLLKLFRVLGIWLDNKTSEQKTFITTGYFIILNK